MDALLTALDFPRWTRGKLGLPHDADLTAEIERHILLAVDHARLTVGSSVVEELSEDTEANADQRRRFASAVHALTESMLHDLHADTLGAQAGSSSQGKRSRNVAPQAAEAARSAAVRSYSRWVDAMLALGYTVRRQARGAFYTQMSR